MGFLLDVFRLGRFHFLFGGWLLFTFGFLAEGGLIYWDYVFGYLVFMFCHLSISYSNEYYDKKSDIAGSRGYFSGGSNVLVEKPQLAAYAYRIALLLTISSIFTGVLFWFKYKPDLAYFFFLLSCNIFTWTYSAPPIRFSEKRFGEIPSALAYGILIPGLGAISTGVINSSWIYWIPLSFLGCSFLLSVQLPDEKTDRISGKMNYTARAGYKKSLKMNFIVNILFSLSMFFLALIDESEIPFAVFSLIPPASFVIINELKKPNRITFILILSQSIFLLSSISWFILNK